MAAPRSPRGRDGHPGRRSSGSPRRPARRSDGRPSSRPERRSGGGRGPARSGRVDDRRRVPRESTAAQRRAAEVAATRGPRPDRDPDAERRRIEERALEVWVDEGSTASVRDEANRATERARGTNATVGSPARRRRHVTVDPDTATEVRAASVDRKHAEWALERLTAAGEALERDRIDEARRLVTPLVKQLPSIAAVHRIAGLVAYRAGRWRHAVTELEAAQALAPSTEHLPVLADAYRALRRWREVERIWGDVRAASPSHEIMAEARIVAAGALADRGDLAGALRTMGRATAIPRRVRDHHLRQWYVLGDLHDRSGDAIEASRWFALVSAHDPEFVDVRERLHALGR